MTKKKTSFAKNLYDVLAPLQQKGDSLTIGIPGGEKVKIKFEDKKYFKPTKNHE